MTDFFSQSEPARLDDNDRPHDRRTVTLSADELEKALTRAVRAGINEAIHNAMSEKNIKLFWHRGFEEMSGHSSAKLRDGVGGAVLRWGAGILAAAGLALWIRFGPWR
jgi:hypothetical protein